MRRASLSLAFTCLALGACKGEPDDGLDTWMDSPPTSTSTTGDPETETGTSEETDTGETDTGEELPFEGLRYVAAASNSAAILAVNLDDPSDIPSPELVSSGEGIAGLLGPTPWGAQAVVHGGEIDQLRALGTGEMQLSALILQESPWVEDLWFDADGTNAIASASSAPLMGPTLLLWMTYDEDGKVINSFDITPPLQDNGAIYVPGRNPAGTHAAIIIDAEADGTWEIYLLPLVPEPGLAEIIDQIDLTGISPIEVPRFLSLTIDDQRISYRREVNPDVWRPVAVPLDAPETDPVNLIVGIDHTYSVVWSEDGNRMLFTRGGVSGYRELRMSDFDGPLSPIGAFTLTEPNRLALVDSQPPLSRAAPGHGFDAMGRIWYANQVDPGLETVEITLCTVPFGGGLMDRALLSDTPPGAVINEIIWDSDTQLLGYRTDSAGLSWISYLDMTAEQPVPVRVDQDFEYFADEPELNASFGWSADRSQIAVAGIQGGYSTLHAAEVGDPGGTTLELELPDISATPGASMIHRPRLSPEGDRIVMWYGTMAGLRGLIHTPTDGSSPAQIVAMPQHALTSGTFMPHEAP